MCTEESSGDLVRMQILIQQDCGGGLRFCISRKFPRPSYAAGLQAILWEERVSPSVSQTLHITPLPGVLTTQMHRDLPGDFRCTRSGHLCVSYFSLLSHYYFSQLECSFLPHMCHGFFPMEQDWFTTFPLSLYTFLPIHRM